MALSLHSLKFDKVKIIQWGVFLALMAVFAGCFWVYYDITNQLERTTTTTTTTQVTVNEANLNKALDAQQNREQNYRTPPLVPSDPFQ